MKSKVRIVLIVLLWGIALGAFAYWMISTRNSLVSRKNYVMEESEYSANSAFTLEDSSYQEFVLNEKSLSAFLATCTAPDDLSWRTSYEDETGNYTYQYRVKNGKIRVDCYYKNSFAYGYIFGGNQVISLTSGEQRQTFTNDGTYNPLSMMHLPTPESITADAWQEVEWVVYRGRKAISAKVTEKDTVTSLIFDCATGLPVYCETTVNGVRKALSTTQEMKISTLEESVFE